MTNKQKLFIKEYLVDLNATKACLRAGYDTENPGKVGPELLGNSRVKQEIQKELSKREARLGIKADRIIEELCKIAFADRSRIVRIENGKLIFTNTDDLEEDEKASIAEISESKFGRSIKTHDKIKALELLGKHLGLFMEKTKSEIIITSDLSDDELEHIARGRGKETPGTDTSS